VNNYYQNKSFPQLSENQIEEDSEEHFRREGHSEWDNFEKIVYKRWWLNSQLEQRKVIEGFYTRYVR